MGFFYKAGAAAGVTVVEGASYDALATSAKTQPHDTLMLDTSTGFYYKVWKTGGPGIPVPVKYFDEVTGYVANGGSVRPNCYFTLDEDDSFVTATAGEDFTFYPGGTGSYTKTAGNPLVLTSPSGSNYSFMIHAAPTSNYDKLLIILKIHSLSGAVRTTNNTIGNMIYTHSFQGSTRYRNKYNLNSTTNNTVHSTNHTGSTPTVTSIGPLIPINAPEWFVFVVDSAAATGLHLAFSTTDTETNAIERSELTQNDTAAPSACALYVGSTSGSAYELQIAEYHGLLI